MNALDLFAGAGGATVAMAALGLDVVGIERDRDACATHHAAGHRTVRADLAGYPWGHLAGAVEVLHASPPCQPFSAAGSHAGQLDDRDGMPYALAAVAALRPRLVTIENVRGLTYKRHAPYLAWLLGELAALGYEVDHRVLNAADYGLAQTRERLFIIARLDGVAPKWPEPTHAQGGRDGLAPWRSMAEALGWAEGLVGFPRRHDTSTEAVTLDGTAYRARDLFPTEGPAQAVTGKCRSWSRWELVRPKGSRNRPRPDDEPAPTITSGKGPNDWRWRLRTNAEPTTPGVRQTRDLDAPAPTVTGASGGRWHVEQPTGAVRVELHELAVLQGFPPDYPFSGTRTSRARQIGNAVPPALLAAVLAVNLDQGGADASLPTSLLDLPLRARGAARRPERPVSRAGAAHRPPAVRPPEEAPDMTTLADMGVDAHRRDRWGRMLVVPPGGYEPVGYTRSTTIAKACDDGAGLAPWTSTMVMLGALARPGLRARWETLVAATGGDPWYASADSKAQCKRLVEDCKAVGGASDRAEQGTSLHALTALVDAGRDIGTLRLSPVTEGDVNAYVHKLISEGITVAELADGRRAVEVTLVNDEVPYAGTTDRIVHVPGFDLPLIADLKTGDLAYSWQAIAVQLASYANACAVYDQGAAPDGSEDVRHPMPEVDQAHGLIINLRPGSAEVGLYVVDIEQGWQALQLSVAVRAWRTSRALAMDLPPLARRVDPLHVPSSGRHLSAVPTSVAGVPRAIDGSCGTPATDAGDVSATGQRPLPPERGTDHHPSASEPFVTGHEQHVAELRAWLQGRIDTIGAHANARASLAYRWTALGVPTLRASTEHTPEQLAAIEALCDDIERDYSFPFGPSRPGGGPPSDTWVTRRLLDVFPGTTTITTTTEEHHHA